MTSPAVILVRPREEGNVGAAARAMANMGLERLILVEPAPRLGGVAQGFGVGGWEILERARRAASFDDAVAPFGRLIGTASLRARRLPGQCVIPPRRLPEVLAADPAGTETALVFGPEDNGLPRHEIERCEPVVAVPCVPEHPTLNLAQAVLILAYELRGSASAPRLSPAEPGDRPPEPLATAAEVRALERQLDGVLLAIGFDHGPIRARLLRDLRRMTVRAAPGSREIRILRRLCGGPIAPWHAAIRRSDRLSRLPA